MCATTSAAQHIACAKQPFQRLFVGRRAATCHCNAMALPLESSAFKDVVVVLGAAGLVIPAFAALRISPVVGFILFGIVAGPFGLGALVGVQPGLYFVTISNPAALAAPAEMGVVLLLFALGLELSAERLRTMRHLVFGLDRKSVV